MNKPNELRVTFNGQLIGHIEVAGRSPRKLVGQFIPSEGFEQNRRLIDEARAFARQFDQSHDTGPLDYLAFDQYIDVLKRLTRMIALPELPSGIEEFAVDQNFKVEVTFGEAMELPPAMPGSDIEQVLRNWIDQSISSTGIFPEGADRATWVAENFIGSWRKHAEDSLGSAELAAHRLREELKRLGSATELGEARHEVTHVQDALAGTDG